MVCGPCIFVAGAEECGYANYSDIVFLQLYLATAGHHIGAGLCRDNLLLLAVCECWIILGARYCCNFLEQFAQALPHGLNALVMRKGFLSFAVVDT